MCVCTDVCQSDSESDTEIESSIHQTKPDSREISSVSGELNDKQPNRSSEPDEGVCSTKKSGSDLNAVPPPTERFTRTPDECFLHRCCFAGQQLLAGVRRTSHLLPNQNRVNLWTAAGENYSALEPSHHGILGNFPLCLQQPETTSQVLPPSLLDSSRKLEFGLWESVFTSEFIAERKKTCL